MAGGAAAPAEPLEVEDIHQLVDLIDLQAVITYGLEARRQNSEVDEPTQELGYTHRVSETQLEARFRFVVTTAEAHLATDIALGYTFDQPITPTESVLLEFAERVAVMAAFPFLREAIFGLASRLGVEPPVLGLVKAGGVRFTPDD